MNGTVLQLGAWAIVALPALAGNIAPQATVTASSQASTQQAAGNAVDGIVDGYPADWTAEWVSAGQGAGAWLELRWPTPQRIDSVTIHDRPNPSENVTAGRLEFDSGAAIPVGQLPNDGTGLVLTFPARTSSSLRFVVVTVSRTPTNIGLAEILVNGAPATSGSCACDPRYSPSPTVSWDYPGDITLIDGFKMYIDGVHVAQFRCGLSDPATLPRVWQCPGANVPLQRYGDWAPGTVVRVTVRAYKGATEGPLSVPLDVCLPCVWDVLTLGRQASYEGAWLPLRCPCQRTP